MRMDCDSLLSTEICNNAPDTYVISLCLKYEQWNSNLTFLK